MIKKILALLFIVLTTSIYSQTEQSSLQNSFEQKGLRCISKETFSQEKIELILNYNFEEYRQPNKSVIIKIPNGPHVELFSTARVKSGLPDIVVEEEIEDPDPSLHLHTPPGEQKIKTFNIIIVDVFHSLPINEEN